RTRLVQALRSFPTRRSSDLLAEEVDHYNGFCLWRDAFGEAVRVQCVGFGMDVSEYGPGLAQGDDFGGGDAAKRRGDDLVAGSDAEHFECDKQCVGAVAGGDNVGEPDGAAEGLFE